MDYMDHAGFDALHAWRGSHEKTGGRVDIDALHEAWQARSQQHGIQREPARAQEPA